MTKIFIPMNSDIYQFEPGTKVPICVISLEVPHIGTLLTCELNDPYIDTTYIKFQYKGEGWYVNKHDAKKVKDCYYDMRIRDKTGKSDKAITQE